MDRTMTGQNDERSVLFRKVEGSATLCCGAMHGVDKYEKRVLVEKIYRRRAELRREATMHFPSWGLPSKSKTGLGICSSRLPTPVMEQVESGERDGEVILISSDERELDGVLVLSTPSTARPARNPASRCLSPVGPLAWRMATGMSKPVQERPGGGGIPHDCRSGSKHHPVSTPEGREIRQDQEGRFESAHSGIW